MLIFIMASIIANHYNNSDNDDYLKTRDEQIFQIISDII